MPDIETNNYIPPHRILTALSHMSHFPFGRPFIVPAKDEINPTHRIEGREDLISSMGLVATQDVQLGNELEVAVNNSDPDHQL